MSRSIGVAVIGMGWMGSVHARSYRLVPQRFPELDIEPRLVVCADNVEARAQEGVTRAGFERATTDWREAVADAEVDAVVITTQNALHAPIALAAIEAGKHVFCEKPVGRSPAETATIAAAAKAAGIISGVGYNYRWAPVIQYALGLIRAGRLGAITHFRGRFLVGYARDPHGVLSWRFDREQSGSGAVADLMSHVADLAHMLAGPVARLVANRHTFITERPLPTPGEGTHFSVKRGGPTGPVTNEDYGSALVQFACGAQGTYEVCRVINGPKCQLAFEISRHRRHDPVGLRAHERAAALPAGRDPRAGRHGLGAGRPGASVLRQLQSRPGAGHEFRRPQGGRGGAVRTVGGRAHAARARPGGSGPRGPGAGRIRPLGRLGGVGDGGARPRPGMKEAAACR